MVGLRRNPQPNTPSPPKWTAKWFGFGPRPKARKLASESPSRMYRICPPVPAGTAGVLGPVASCDDRAAAGTAVRAAVSTAAVAPAVDATTRMEVPPTARGAASHPRHPRRRPRRMGISRTWYEMAATPTATDTLTANRGQPDSP